MFKDSSTKYDQDNKDRLHKRLVKHVKLFLKKKQKESNNMVVNAIKISRKIKNKGWLKIEKNITKKENASL